VTEAERRAGEHSGDGAPPPDALLDGLTDAQRRAVVSEATTLCVLAAAGAGKTRVLTRRIAYRALTGGADPAHVLALTFTRKAAGELSDRVRGLGLRDRVATGTFHAVAAAQLRRWWADRGQTPPVILERKGRILGPLVAERPALAGVPLAEIAGHLEWARARLIQPEHLAASARLAGRPLPVPGHELGALMQRYEHEKLRRGLIDFDDLLARCADAMERDPAFAAAQRWRWRHVFVDEFQDVNPLQYRLLLAWLGDSEDLCVVGDPNQAIYGWNGADPELLEQLPQRWPGVEIVRLDANHRCRPPIVAAAAAVLGRAGAPLSSSRLGGADVTTTAWPSAEAEGHGVAAAVRRAHTAGTPWSGMAILVRTNAQAVTIAEACRRAAVPVRTPGHASLVEHPAARRALEQLRRRPDLPVGAAVADLEEWAAGHRPGDHGGGDSDAASVLGALADLARHAGRLDEGLPVGGWLTSLPAMLGRDGDAPAGEAVTVCSFHRAKGLEWAAVWVCGLEEGLVPIGHATSPAAIAEERRLLYVGLTRAGDELHCSFAQKRSFGGRPVPRTPSRWLEAIAGTVRAGGAGPDDEAVGEPTPEQWQQRLAAQRDKLRAGRPSARRGPALPAGWPPPNGPVLEALRSWRAATARASAVPAHVVLHDTVLVALASSRPVDEAGLLAVPGLGPVKASRYGPTLLALCAAHGMSA
jgi:DNA helicase-2/ATP-dependent DNA helicase PcrA